MAMTSQHAQFLTNAHNFFVGHQGAVGALVTDTGEVLLIRSGEHGGPWGGTHRGGFPRGAGWGFTQGGPSQGNIATHVEGHAAAIMWQRKLKSATLLVDRAMCNICSRDLPSALPPGTRLVVISHDEGETQVRSSHAEGDDVREVLAELRQYQERLLSFVNLYSGEHAAQLKLLTTSFAGFAVNKVFNSKEPDMVIWNNAFGALAAARREINQGNAKEALKALIRARFYYVWALRKYLKWKDGIEIAGQKAQVAIGATAVVLIAAAVVATAATVAAGATAGVTASTGAATTAGAEAATLTATQQTLAAVAQGERVILAVDELIEAEEVVEQAVRFL